ncbi:hypothetical protein ACM66B_002955 [Microbotryomycetes sp. NB124-2]
MVILGVNMKSALLALLLSSAGAVLAAPGPVQGKNINARALAASFERALARRGYPALDKRQSNSTGPGGSNNDDDDDDIQETISDGVRGLQRLITAAQTVVTQNGCAMDCDMFSATVRCATEGQDASCACSENSLARARSCEACIDDFEETLPQDQRGPYNDLDDAYDDYEDLCELLQTRPSLAPTLSQPSSAAATGATGQAASDSGAGTGTGAGTGAATGSNAVPTQPTSAASQTVAGASLLVGCAFAFAVLM